MVHYGTYLAQGIIDCTSYKYEVYGDMDIKLMHRTRIMT